MSDAAAGWVVACPASELAPGKLRVVEISGRRLALGQRTDGYFAVDDQCPHAGASLGEGMIDGDHVICPLHAYAYDSRSGVCDDDGGRVEVFEVRRVGDQLEVRLP